MKSLLNYFHLLGVPCVIGIVLWIVKDLWLALFVSLILLAIPTLVLLRLGRRGKR